MPSSRRSKWGGSEAGADSIRETCAGTESRAEGRRRGWLVLVGGWPPAWARRERQWTGDGGEGALIDGVTGCQLGTNRRDSSSSWAA